MKTILALLLLVAASSFPPVIAQICTNGALHLIGGPVDSAGTMEVCIGGVWATVCGSSWDNNDAKVVCRQLGYPVDTPGAWAVSYQLNYGLSTTPMFLDNVHCTGTESSLLNCSHSSGVGVYYCRHGGVVCPSSQGCTHGHLRLAGGQSANEGRVEICISGVWGTVCGDYYWNSNDARVVCRQLGFPVDAPRAACFGQGTGPTLLSNLQCNGTESSLLSCSRNENNYYCGNAAGVECQCYHGTLRLTGGRIPEEGRVEVCMNGAWGHVCNSRLDYRNAFVVCRQLGYPATGAVAILNDYLGQHVHYLHGQSITSQLCYGNESRLLDCGYYNSTCSISGGVYCQGETVADPPCSEGVIRLAGGRVRTEGRVEVCSNGVWRMYSGNWAWDSREATVVCRQLQYQHGRVFVFRGYNSINTFGSGTAILYTGLTDCNGTELSLNECRNNHYYLRYRRSHEIDNNNGVGVQCDHIDNSVIDPRCTNGTVHLFGGQNNGEGTVEICVGEVWGSVCDNSWDSSDATVVCQQLGYQGTNATVYSNAHFGESSGPYHLDNLYCDGYETNLLNCRRQYTEVGVHRCSPGNEAGVRCDVTLCSHGDVRLVGGYTSYEGRVQVCINGYWGRVCRNGWNTAKALVVCRQLFGQNILAVPLYNFGRDTGNIMLYGVTCTESSTRLVDCSYQVVQGSSSGGCSINSYQDTGVRCYVPSNCTTGAVRLVDGRNETEGRVEVCRSRVWGAVGFPNYYRWNFRNARVTCRQLGYPSEWAIALSTSVFGRGNAPILTINVRCTGDENSLYRCAHSSRSASSYNYYYSVAGVICQGNTTSSQHECSSGDVRLVGGERESEGRVEICVEGFWGTVCNNTHIGSSGQQELAVVVCRQKGFTTRGATSLAPAYFGEGSGPVLSFITCTGRESHIGECNVGSVGAEIDCHHGKDVAVRCQSPPYHQVTVTVDPPNNQFSIGSIVTLQCIVNPLPPQGATYVWSDSLPNTYMYSTHPNLTVTIQANHPSQGHYYCNVSLGGSVLGVGSATIEVKGLLNIIGPSRVQFTPPHNVTLQVEFTTNVSKYYHIHQRYVNIRYLFRALTWYHNGNKLMSNERITLSSDNTTLMVTNSTLADGGVYEVRFDGLQIYPYSRTCEEAVLDLLRHYPVFKAAVFHLGTPSDALCSSTGLQTEAQIYFHGVQTAMPFTVLQNISLQVSGRTCVKVYPAPDSGITTLWYRNGGYLPLGSQLGPLKRPFLNVSQSLTLKNSSLLDEGTYEALLTTNSYTHLNSRLRCYNYYSFVSTLGMNTIILAQAKVQLKYYESPSLILQTSEHTIVKSDNVSLICSATGGYPPITNISFLKNSNVIAYTTTESRLQISTADVASCQFGLYTCLVNNSVLSFQESTLLRERSDLQMHLDLMSTCNNWNETTYEVNSGLLRENIARIAQEQCSCNITSTSLEDSYLNCSGNGSRVVFTTTVVYSTDSGDITASDVINFIKQWANTNSARDASVMIGGEAAMVSQVCSPSCNETDLEETEEHPSHSSTVTTASSTPVPAEPTEKETMSPSNTAATTAGIPIGGPTTANSTPEPTEKITISPSNTAMTTVGGPTNANSTPEPTEKETISPSNTAVTTVGGPTNANSTPEPTEKETISPSNTAITTVGIFIGGLIAGIVVLTIPVAIACIIRKKKTHGTSTKPAAESHEYGILPKVVTNPLFECPTAEDGYGVQIK